MLVLVHREAVWKVPREYLRTILRIKLLTSNCFRKHILKVRKQQINQPRHLVLTLTKELVDTQIPEKICKPLALVIVLFVRFLVKFGKQTRG